MMTGVPLLERSVHVERRETKELAVGRTLVFAAHPDGGALCSFHVPRPRECCFSGKGGGVAACEETSTACTIAQQSGKIPRPAFLFLGVAAIAVTRARTVLLAGSVGSFLVCRGQGA